MDFGTSPPSGRRCDGAPDEAVEPVVVGPFRALAPFLHLTPVSECRDVGFRAGHVLAEQVMFHRLLAKKRQRAGVAVCGRLLLLKSKLMRQAVTIVLTVCRAHANRAMCPPVWMNRMRPPAVMARAAI